MVLHVYVLDGHLMTWCQYCIHDVTEIPQWKVNVNDMTFSHLLS